MLLDPQNLPQDARIYEFALDDREERLGFLQSFSELFCTKADPDQTGKIKRWGISGEIGSGKSTLALDFLNSISLCTRTRSEWKNRGCWSSAAHGEICLYDNFTDDYHRFEEGAAAEAEADISIVEHPDVDKRHFDCLTIIEAGAEADQKTLLMVVSDEVAASQDFEIFLNHYGCDI